MNGVSLHWFANLFEKQAVGDFGGSFARSLLLGLMVMVVDRGRLAARRPRLPPALPRARRRSSTSTVASLIVPSILVSLGIGLGLPDRRHPAGLVLLGLRRAPHLDAALRPPHHVRGLQPLRQILRGGGPRPRRQPWQTFRHVVLPIILPSLIGVGLFGFTLSYDEFARTLMTVRHASTPCRSKSTRMTTNVTTPVLYALGTLTTPSPSSSSSAPSPRSWSCATAAPAASRPDAVMRILVVNPNTTAIDDSEDRRRRPRRRRPGTEIIAVNPDEGPASIEGYLDGALAVPGLLARDREGRSGERRRRMSSPASTTPVSTPRAPWRGRR